jgi:hypothetical protein
MSVNVELERLYERVELVRGWGNPRKGRLCIMSFVAYLAGEAHTDWPHTASPTIRNFAVLLNDLAPKEWRQELKPFAPRIIGTNDSYDRVRSEMLFRAMTDEVVAGGPAHPVRAYAVGTNSMWDSYSVTAWAGHLLSILVRNAPTSDCRRWYWIKALELLDRLCDIGAEERASNVRLDRVEDMRVALDRRRASTDRLHHFVGATSKAAQGIPLLYRNVLEHVL